MIFKAVIFDLDGTLIDSLMDLGNATNRALSRHGFPGHSLADYKYFIGEGAEMLIRYALPESQRQNDMIKKVLQDLRADYGVNWHVDTNPYDGILKVLSFLIERDLKMAVLSNKPHDFTCNCVSHFFPATPFAMVLGQRSGVPAKPHPAGAHEIASHLKFSPGQILYLGDSGIDMTTAVAAGMYPVGALWGFRTEKELIMAGAKAVLAHPLDLLRLLEF